MRKPWSLQRSQIQFEMCLFFAKLWKKQKLSSLHLIQTTLLLSRHSSSFNSRIWLFLLSKLSKSLLSSKQNMLAEFLLKIASISSSIRRHSWINYFVFLISRCLTLSFSNFNLPVKESMAKMSSVGEIPHQ